MSARCSKSSNHKSSIRMQSYGYIPRNALAKYQSSEPKSGGGKLASNLARLNARSRPKAFYVSFVQEQLTKYLENNQRHCKYDSLGQLLNAAKKNALSEGQLILEVVDVSRHQNAIPNIYKGWLSVCVDSVMEYSEPNDQ